MLAGLMLAIAAVDHRRMIIPDELNALAFIVGLVAAGIGTEGPSSIAILQALAQALVRASLMFVLFFAFRVVFRMLRGAEGMGFGDVKLAAVAGVWLDWAFLPVAIEIAALSALAVALYARFRGPWVRPESEAALRRFFRASDLDLLGAHRVARRLGSSMRSQYLAVSGPKLGLAIGAQADARRCVSAS